MRGIAAILCLLTGCALAAESSTDLEKVDALIKQLSSEDFDARESATAALRKAGDSIWPRLEPLLKSEDGECAYRVRILARDLAVIRPDQADLVKTLIEKLEDADSAKRVEGLDGILNLGPAGIRIARKHLSGEGSQPAIKLTIDKVAVEAGEKLTGKGTLSNEGKAPFWMTNVQKPLSWSCSRNSGFGEERPRERFGCGGRRLMVKRHGGYQNPIQDFHAVPPGRHASELEINEQLTESGIYTGSACVAYDAISGRTIFPRMPETADTEHIPQEVLLGSAGEKQDPNTVALELGKGLTEQQRKPTDTVKFFVLPPAGRPSSDDNLELSLTREEVSKDEPAGCICVDTKLTAKIQSGTLRLEKDLAKYAWYVLLDSKGIPVKWGSWQSVLRVANEAALSARTLEKSGSAAWQLAIPAPESGTYSIILGYEIDPGGDNSKAVIDFDLKPEDTDACYNSGKLYARLNDIDLKK